MKKTAKDYIFALFNEEGQYMDQTSLNEPNHEEAMHLFLDEFEWKNIAGDDWFVLLIDESDVDQIDMIDALKEYRENNIL